MSPDTSRMHFAGGTEENPLLCGPDAVLKDLENRTKW